MRMEKWILTIPLRLRSLFHRNAVEQELDEEIRDHIDRQTQQNVSKGMAAEAARRTAETAMRGQQLFKEECRDMRRVNFFQDFLQDMRFALRMLRKSPGFTVVAVLTLALGIGANTAIFSVVSGVILRPLPYPQSERLVQFFEVEPQVPKAPLTGPDYLDWKAQTHSLEDMAAGTVGNKSMTGAGDPARLTVMPVTTNMLNLLGVAPAIGRTFLPGEGYKGRDQVAVITYGLWQRSFGGDPNVIHKTMRLDGNVYDIIGVMPGNFQFPRIWGTTPDCWTPITAERLNQSRGNHWLFAIGRLKPGATIQQAQAEAMGTAQQLARQYPDTNAKIGALAIGLHEQLVGALQTPLLMLQCAVGFVLLIACANIANLLLTRNAARSREVAIRSTLGASRGRIARQLLTESLVLGLAGGLLGLLVAYWAKKSLLAAAVGYLNATQAKAVQLDSGVLAFCILLGIGGSFLFGALSAFSSSKTGLSSALKESAAGAGSSVAGKRIRGPLAVLELALALITLAGAGLMVRSLWAITRVDIGARTQNVLTFDVDLPESKYNKQSQVIAFFDNAMARIRAIPGVISVGATNKLPLLGGRNGGIDVEGQPTGPEFSSPLVEFSIVTPEYFSTMGIRLLRGRIFTDSDLPNSALVVVINQTLGEKFWPGQDPIGKRVSLDGRKHWCEVAGVVSDVRQWGVTEKVLPEIYLAQSQDSSSSLFITVRSTVDPLSLTPAIKKVIGSLDPEIPMVRVRTMDQVLNSYFIQPRFQALLLGIFAALAAVLAAVGIYGVIAYGVSLRTREIGVRVALGAQRGQVLWMVLRHGIAIAVAGVALGLAGALSITGLLKTLLYGVQPNDPETLVVVSIGMIAVAVLACVIPALRAMRVDPVIALRYE